MHVNGSYAQESKDKDYCEPSQAKYQLTGDEDDNVVKTTIM